MKSKWRLWLGIQMGRIARGLECFAIGMMTPDDLIEWNRRYYGNFLHSGGYDAAVDLTLSEAEDLVVAQFFSRPGTVLVLGCGTGREAIALAKKGWSVVGVDHVEALIARAQSNAQQSGADVEWRCQDITQGATFDRTFDLISLLGQVYSCLPTQGRRVRLLESYHKLLKSDGCIFMNLPPIKPVTVSERKLHGWRMGFVKVLGGNHGCQLGDQWSLRHEFFHRFESLAEFESEVNAAGLSLEWGNNGIPREIVVLKTADKRPSQ